jgi:uncharacterized integral membrane protein
VPLALLVIVFAIANRQFVTLSLDPINPSDPSASVDMPLWLLFFAGTLIGVIVGYVSCWFAQGKHRKRARDLEVEAVKLRSERDQLASQARQDPEPAREIVPMGTGWI